MFIDYALRQPQYSFTKHEHSVCDISTSKLSNVVESELILVKPKSFMNVNGHPLISAFKRFQPTDLILFHDELEKPLGKWTLKDGGSANGHNGIKSVIKEFGMKEFKRYRIGIGRPTSRDPESVCRHVLGDFTNEELECLNESVFPAIHKELIRLLLYSHRSATSSQNE